MQVAIRVRPSLPREYKVVLGSNVAFDVFAFVPRFCARAKHDNCLCAKQLQNTTLVDQQRRTITLSENLRSSVASGNTSTAHVDNGVVS